MPEENGIEVCDYLSAHESVVSEVREHMPDEDTLFELAEFYKVFGDSTRIRILMVLCRHEMCVCDLASALSMTKSSISHQLSKMREHGVVKFRREGKEVYYSLDDGHVASIFELTLEHINHKE